MKRLIFLAIWLMGWAGWVFAQGEGPLISDWCVCVADITCEDVDGCLDAANCSSTTFTVVDDAPYVFTASTECSGGGSCKNCRVCAVITYSQGSYPVCENGTNCNSNCNPPCNQVWLHPGITYTLKVCKLPCGEHSCSDCGANCRAVACIKNWSGAKCPNP